MSFLAVMSASASAMQSPGSPAEIWAHIVADFSNIGSAAALSAFVQVLMIDVLLAGDNAIVVGALAAGLPAAQRKRVILIGIIAALVLRIAFALVVSQLMQIVGLILAGGLLLLWVSWKMWRELHHGGESPGSPEMSGDEHSGLRPAKSFCRCSLGCCCGGRINEPRQCARGGGRCTCAPRYSHHRADPLGSHDGRGGKYHRQIYRALSLDRLFRPDRNPLCRRENGL